MSFNPLVLLLSTALAAPTAALTRVTDRHGVLVYRVDGQQAASAIDVQADGIIAAAPERVLAALLDYASAPRWVEHVGESRVLSSGAGSLLVYQHLTLPVIADRDFTLRVTSGHDGATLWTRFETANAEGPAPRPGIVRVTLHEGGWTLEPIRTSDGAPATRARYQFRLDLAGSLPRWMARKNAGKTVPELYEALRRECGAASVP